MKYLIIHGAFGTPNDNWFPELKDRLESLNQEVLIPQFPVDTWDNVTEKGENKLSNIQNLDNWIKEFDKLYPSIKQEKLCIIGHSAACIFILHIVERYKLNLDSAIFVSPFLEELNKSWQIDKVNESFYKTDFNFKELKKQIPISYALYSNNDPYVDAKYSLDFSQRLNSSPIIIKSAGHFNSEAGIIDFPLVFELCKTRLNLYTNDTNTTHK